MVDLAVYDYRESHGARGGRGCPAEQRGTADQCDAVSCKLERGERSLDRGHLVFRWCSGHRVDVAHDVRARKDI